MAFRKGWLYVFCMDRQPVPEWITDSGEKRADMQVQLPHVTAIVELRPKLCVSTGFVAGMPGVEASDIQAYANLSPDFMCVGLPWVSTLVRNEGGTLVRTNMLGETAALPSPEAVLEELLDIIRRCTWTEHYGPLPAEIGIPDDAIVVKYRKEGINKRLVAFQAYRPARWFVVLSPDHYLVTELPMHALRQLNDRIYQLAGGDGSDD